MLKVNKMTDRLRVRVGDYIFHLSPLSYIQKAEVNSFVKVNGTQVHRDLERSAYCVFKYSIKEIEGDLTYADGSKFELKFEDQDKLALTDDCLSEIMNIKWPSDILFIANSMIDGIPDKITSPIDGTEIDGIEIVDTDDSKKK